MNVLRIENKKLKRELKEMKVGYLARNIGNTRGSIECVKEKMMPSAEGVL